MVCFCPVPVRCMNTVYCTALFTTLHCCRTNTSSATGRPWSTSPPSTTIQTIDKTPAWNSGSELTMSSSASLVSRRLFLPIFCVRKPGMLFGVVVFIALMLVYSFRHQLPTACTPQIPVNVCSGVPGRWTSLIQPVRLVAPPLTPLQWGERLPRRRLYRHLPPRLQLDQAGGEVPGVGATILPLLLRLFVESGPAPGLWHIGWPVHRGHCATGRRTTSRAGPKVRRGFSSPGRYPGPVFRG